MHGLRQTYHRLRKSYWTHLVVLLGDEAQVDARFALFGDSANLDARSVHGLRRTYQRLGNNFGRARWKILGYVGHVQSCLGQFGTVLVLMQDRCTVCAKRTIGSETILDAPDGKCKLISVF